MNLAVNKIILLGGCGFLGLETAKILKKNNYDVIIYDLPTKKNICPNNCEFREIDLINNNLENTLNIEKNDIVINLASRQYIESNIVPYFGRQEWFNKLNYHVSNITLQIAIDKNALGYIFFSTDMVYGIPKSLPVSEKNDKNPIAEYGISKLKAENFLLKKSLNNIPLTIFRPRLISGPGRQGVFKTLFKLINKSLPVPMIGKGENCYQMVSVFDCAYAILLAIENKIPNQVFNLASEKKIKVKDLMKNLINYADSNSVIIPINSGLIKSILRSFDLLGKTILYKEQYSIADKDIILNIDKAKNLLKWIPKYDDQAMINATYDYWLKNVK